MTCDSKEKEKYKSGVLEEVPFSEAVVVKFKGADAAEENAQSEAALLSVVAVAEGFALQAKKDDKDALTAMYESHPVQGDLATRRAVLKKVAGERDKQESLLMGWAIEETVVSENDEDIMVMAMQLDENG